MKKIFVHEDHKMVSRRDFLSAGLITFTATAFAPAAVRLAFSKNGSSFTTVRIPITVCPRSQTFLFAP